MKIVIKFWCHFFKFRQPAPGDCWEVMVLVVISDVKKQEIPGTVVGVCFLSLVKYIVFGDKMS